MHEHTILSYIIGINYTVLCALTSGLIVRVAACAQMCVCVCVCVWACVCVFARVFIYLFIYLFTKRNSGWRCLSVDPEADPGYDDIEICRQINLEQIITNLSRQLEFYIQNWASFWKRIIFKVY